MDSFCYCIGSFSIINGRVLGDSNYQTSPRVGSGHHLVKLLEVLLNGLGWVLYLELARRLVLERESNVNNCLEKEAMWLVSGVKPQESNSGISELIGVTYKGPWVTQRQLHCCKLTPAWVRTQGSWNPGDICRTPKQLGRWEGLFPSFLSAYITLAIEDACVSGLLQGFPVTFKLFSSQV